MNRTESSLVLENELEVYLYLGIEFKTLPNLKFKFKVYVRVEFFFPKYFRTDSLVPLFRSGQRNKKKNGKEKLLGLDNKAAINHLKNRKVQGPGTSEVGE